MQDLPVRVQTQQPKAWCQSTCRLSKLRPTEFSDPAETGLLRAYEWDRILRFPVVLLS